MTDEPKQPADKMNDWIRQKMSEPKPLTPISNDDLLPMPPEAGEAVDKFMAQKMEQDGVYRRLQELPDEDTLRSEYDLSKLEPVVGLRVADAARLGQQKGLDQVVMLGYSNDQGRTSLATWGRNAQDKLFAARAGDMVIETVTKLPKELGVTEDFRMEAAFLKARVDQLEKQLASLLTEQAWKGSPLISASKEIVREAQAARDAGTQDRTDLIDDLVRHCLGLLNVARGVEYALNQKFDDICWMDLYKRLSGLLGIAWEPKVLPKALMMRNCEKFADSMIQGCPYQTPPLDDLEALFEENLRLVYDKGDKALEDAKARICRIKALLGMPA